MTRRKSASALPMHMNGRIYDPLLGRFLSADVKVPNPSNLQDFNRYSYVRNNPLRHVDPSGYDPIEDQDRLEAERLERLKNQVVDQFEGKEEYRQLYTYIEESGGSAFVDIVDERPPTGPEILSANSPKPDLIENIELADTKGSMVLNTAIQSNATMLFGPDRGPEGNVARLNDLPATEAQSDVEITQSVKETKTGIKRGRDGETSTTTKTTTSRQTTGTVNIRNPRAATRGANAAEVAKVAATVVTEGIKVVQQSRVNAGLVYRNAFLGVVKGEARGRIVVSTRQNVASIQQFAENHGLPALNFDKETGALSVRKEE